MWVVSFYDLSSLRDARGCVARVPRSEGSGIRQGRYIAPYLA